MMRLLGAEIRKVLTTRLWWGMLLGALAFTALEVVQVIVLNGRAGSGVPSLSSPAAQHTLIGVPAQAYIFSVIVGIIVMTTEFRHFTTRPTFLGQPHRGRVIAAKIVVAGAIGLVYAVGCIVVTLAITIPWLGATGQALDWSGNSLYLEVLASAAVVMLFAIIGLGIGTLIRSQIAAVIATLIYLLIGESIIGGLGTLWPWLASIHEYLPGPAAHAVTQVGEPTKISVLAPWAGGVVLFGWGILFAVLGWFEATSRDIP